MACSSLKDEEVDKLDGVETSCHALVDCPAAKAVWSFDYLRKVSKAHEVVDFVQDIVRVLNKDELCFIFVMMWIIWFERNSKIYGCSGRDPGGISKSAAEYFR
ncbi:hypothetical protein TorRG33x02_069110 [Trema orientale]|uniref:Uncharacterized protein n=1 Tax=Trema orientale TaxID=63057 RepID=A0A2P5FH74_TREOI|nr:hypothetical protein TorRG33x02_069110 [Trema orientale]